MTRITEPRTQWISKAADYSDVADITKPRITPMAGITKPRIARMTRTTKPQTARINGLDSANL